MIIQDPAIIGEDFIKYIIEKMVPVEKDEFYNFLKNYPTRFFNKNMIVCCSENPSIDGNKIVFYDNYPIFYSENAIATYSYNYEYKNIEEKIRGNVSDMKENRYNFMIKKTID